MAELDRYRSNVAVMYAAKCNYDNTVYECSANVAAQAGQHCHTDIHAPPNAYANSANAYTYADCL